MFKNTVLLMMLSFSSMLSAEMRDPTLPGNLPVKVLALPINKDVNLKLTEIWIYPRNSRVTINGTRYKKGGLLPDGSTLQKIRPHYIVIIQNGISKKIELVPSIKNLGK